MLNEFESELNRLRVENSQLRYQKDLKERDLSSVMFENQTLYTKLENLENVFIGQPLQRGGDRGDAMSAQYAQSNLAAENAELKRKLAMMEQELAELRFGQGYY